MIRTGLKWNLWMSATLTLVFLLFPEFFIKLFTRDAETLRVGVPYLRILSLCLVFNGVEIVTMESILGSGHTVAFSWIFSTFSLLRIPLAFLVPDWTGTGALGIAWVISITCIVRAVIIAGWAMRGTWTRGLRRELHGAEPPPIEPPGAA